MCVSSMLTGKGVEGKSGVVCLLFMGVQRYSHTGCSYDYITELVTRANIELLYFSEAEVGNEAVLWYVVE